MDDDKFRRLLHEVLDERPRIDTEVHAEHHEFIKQWIDRERIKAERWEDIRRQLCGWGVISMAGAIGLWAQDYAAAIIKAIAHSVGVRL
jgi:hypothetical protein